MKLIIPMAGMGKRMRPHTLTIPKPLIHVAGKPIVMRLVEEIVKVAGEPIDEIGFVTGHFGAETEKDLLNIASRLGAKGHIFYQDIALGTAHAILCAQEIMNDKVIIAFADTLFKADFSLDTSKESIIWVQKVDNPSAFGVVKKNENGIITDFVEKPKHFVSDEAIIGIYYFKDGSNLRDELQFLIDNNISKGGEFQLTDGLENMKNKGIEFYTGAVREWLDCGNKDATVFTNGRVLANDFNPDFISNKIKNSNSVIVEPSFIGDDVVLENSIVGPFVSIGNGCLISNSVISNSIIQNNCIITSAIIDNSMMGSYSEFKGVAQQLSISDYSTID
jgi:glucose-1-phosphate thymidylyltransferase